MKTYTKEDISEKIELENGLTATVSLEHDQDHGAPWEEFDGHGSVTEWTHRDKRAGERVLCSERGGAKRFYDYAGAIKTAKADGWDAPPYKTGTKGEQAVRAVEADFKYLQDWCEDRWQYVCVVVTLLDSDGNEIASDALGGVEDLNGYAQVQAAEMLNTLLEQNCAEEIESHNAACRDIATQR